MEDSVYNYRVDELFNKRTEVEVNDDVPTYYHKSKRYVRGKKARVGKRYKATRKRSSASRKKYTARKSTKKSSRKRRSTKRRRR